MRWLKSLLWLSLATAATATAAAQRPAPAPTPAASATPATAPTPQARPCDECAAIDELRAKEQQLHAEMQRLYDQALDAQETLREQNDSASRAAYQEAVRDYQRSQTAYSETVRKLMRLETERAQREMEQQVDKIRMRMRRSPKGWFGIYFSGEAKSSRDKDGRDLLLWVKYPLIESVEPDSPAEKGGIESGDVLVAIDANDVTKVPVSFGEILVPGRRVTLKVRHGRTTVDRVVLVEKRPPNEWASPPGMAAIAPRAPAAAEMGEPPEAPQPPDAPTAWRTPLPPMARIVPAVPGDMQVSVYFEDMTVAGARVQRFAALKEYFGVDSGVLVLSVMPGTPAARAGLRDGDVIVRAGGKTVSDPGRLSRQIERASGNSLSLEIVRQRKKQTLVLKW